MNKNYISTSKPNKRCRPLRPLLNSFALTSAVALAGLSFTVSDADASQWYVNGDTIYYTGGTVALDPATFRAIMANAAREGVTIRRIVLRNGPGGAAIGGTGLGQAIREFQLDTVMDGGCYSACTAAYVGGVNRFFTDYDLPVLGIMGQFTFGIHGASRGNIPVSNREQQQFIDHFRNLLGPDVWAIAGERIILAHTGLTDSQGFLNYLNPRSSLPTTFCPGGNRGATGNCTSFPGVTLVTDGIATSPNYFVTNDRRFITDTVSTPFQSGMETTRWYRNSFAFLADSSQDFIDTLTGIDRTPSVSLGERISTVVVTPGGHWNLNSELTLPYAIVDGGKMTLGSNAVIHDLEGLGVRNGGTLLLTGGNVSGSLIASNRALVTGRGSIGATGHFSNSDLLAHDITLRPYSEGPMGANGNFASLRETPLRLGLGRITTLQENSNLILSTAPDQTSAPLKLTQARYFTTGRGVHRFSLDFGGGLIFPLDLEADQLVVANRKSMLSISADSNLLLNFTPGHYQPLQRLDLVQGIVDNTVLTRPEAICSATDTPLYCDLLTPEELAKAPEEGTFISGRFMKAGRVDDPTNLVDTSSDGAIIYARANSLLTFGLFQNENGIYLKANPAFEDVALFGNKASGNGLGDALRTASWDKDTRLGPVLGPLQFSNRNVARREASTLRGDPHASLRLVSRSLIDQFSDTLFTSRQNPATQSIVNPLAVAEAQGLSDNQGQRMGIGGSYVGTANMTASTSAGVDAPTTRSPYDMNVPTQVFATGFGLTGRLQGDDRISRLEYNGFGILMGASRNLSDRTRVGAALGYGQTKTNARPANNFNANTDTLLGAVFGDFQHNRGTLSVQAGYAQITQDTSRSLFDIPGLETASKAEYDNNAYFARLEHGLKLNRGTGAQVTLLAPVVDYINLEGATVNEEGSSPANLRLQADKLESLRAGLGLHVERQFAVGESGVTPYARVVYQREFMDREATSTNNFLLSPGLPFKSVSRELGEDSVEWNLGLRSTTRNDNLNVAVEYQGRAIKGETAHGAQISLKYSF